MKKRLDDAIQVLLAILVSARILENEKGGSLRESNRSFKSSKSLRESRFV